jgi:hypothetical protein
LNNSKDSTPNPINSVPESADREDQPWNDQESSSLFQRRASAVDTYVVHLQELPSTGCTESGFFQAQATNQMVQLLK